ncbi:MAG: TIGR00153 family protein [Pseudomonadales bacterium]
MAMGNPFGKMFGKSPFKPIQDHMAKAHSCAEALIPFFEATLAKNWKLATEKRKVIAKLEGDADKLKRSVRLHLPKNLFLPVPRTDLLDMLTMQDKIANVAKDISGLILGRKMEIPEFMAESLLAFVKEALTTSAQALKAIDELDELVETGFGGREVQLVENLIKELDRLEHVNDKTEVKIRAALFKLEKDLPPVDVMFLYKVIDGIGDLADRAQKVGNRLQLLIAR